MLIDTHCHFPDKRYNKTPDELIDEAKENGVEKLINIGTNLKDNEKVLGTLKEFPNVYGSLGIYPHEEIDKTPADILPDLERQLSLSEKIVGVGECGIDLSDLPNQRPLSQQIELFEGQIQIAARAGKALVIHNRNADEQILKTLENFASDSLTGVAHCFVSTWEVAQKFLDLNFYISFSAIITYNSGTPIHETVKKVPNDKFVLETDSPFLPPQLSNGKRPKINEPKYVKIVAEKVSEIKNLPVQEIEALSYQNSCKLFKI